MKFAKFGATGLTVSKLCLGTATFGKQTEEAEAQRILEKAADAGVDFIDTADGYPMGADFVTSVILGASRVDQLDATLAAVQFEMSADLKKRLDDLTVEFRRGDAAR